MMKLRHMKIYCQSSGVWIKPCWALGRDLGHVQNPHVNHGPPWLPLVVITITRLGGSYMGGHPVESTDSPQLSENNYCLGGYGSCRHSCARSPFFFRWLSVKVVGVSLQRVDPVPQPEDYKAISQQCPHHTQRNWGTEEIVCSRSPHYNVTQKKMSAFSSHKTGKIILWRTWKIKHWTEIFNTAFTLSYSCLCELFISDMVSPACSFQYRRKELTLIGCVW